MKPSLHLSKKINLLTLKKTVTSFILIIIFAFVISAQKKQIPNDQFISYVLDPSKQALKLYYKNQDQKNFSSIYNLKTYLSQQHKTLIFATNAGMYNKNHEPQGLYIENQRLITPLDTSTAAGNFYLKPNGVFYLSNNNQANICVSESFPKIKNVKYATQSGPMLVINGELHPAFTKGSKNVYVRNGVGILPDKKVLFAMSKKEINLHNFATFFKSMGCKNALYLDGFVSRTYLPEARWTQLDGDFGVMFGVTE